MDVSGSHRAAVGTDVGGGVASERNGLLRRRHVRSAWTSWNETTETAVDSTQRITDELRAPWRERNCKLLYVLRPRQPFLANDGCDFCAASSRGHFQTDSGFGCAHLLRTDGVCPVV